MQRTARRPSDAHASSPTRWLQQKRGERRVCSLAPQRHALIACQPHAGGQLVFMLRSKIVDQHTAVIALCHDPRIDDMALMEALNQDAFYIGAMGSERTSSKRRERLLSLDIAQSQIDRLHAPVGLPLGSKTPPEIAIAILAELTQLRASASKIA